MNFTHVSIKTVFMSMLFSGVIAHAQNFGRVMSLSDFAQKGETARQTYDRVIAENDYVVVKFYLSHCPPCKALAPEFASQAQKYTNVLFLEIDAAMYDDLSTQLNVRSVPTLMLYKNHQKITQWVGGDKQRLRSELGRLLQ